MKRLLIFSLILLMVSVLGVWFFRSKAIIKAQSVNPTPIPSYDSSEWYMAGANPQRTSHVDSTVENTTEIKGNLNVEWYVPIEPYIPYYFPVIASNDRLFISTARGLYTFNSSDGSLGWVFPTELPLGHAPTVINGIVYVGGLDHNLYAIDEQTGQELWHFTGEKGFMTNPLVIPVTFPDNSVKNIVYAGNRDGFMYAIQDNGTSGSLLWKYKTGADIMFSASTDPNNTTIYFASNDSYAYALDSVDGTLKWQSAKLPGAGFTSWWPVYYQNQQYGDQIIFFSRPNYRSEPLYIDANNNNINYPRDEVRTILPNQARDPQGTYIGFPHTEQSASNGWVQGTTVIDTSKPNNVGNGDTYPTTEYFENKPWRRLYVVLSANAGTELQYSYQRTDGTTGSTYAPILWSGTKWGNRQPPVVGYDGILYQQAMTESNNGIVGGNIVGWKLGTPLLSDPISGWNAFDEEMSYSSAGTMLYWSIIDDRVSGGIDLSQPLGTANRSWQYIGYNVFSLVNTAPGYDELYAGSGPRNELDGLHMAFGGINGIYSMDQNNSPPIPYKGRLYIIRSNALIAFGTNTTKTHLPTVHTVPFDEVSSATTRADIQTLLTQQIQKILDASNYQNSEFLRPGFLSSGHVDLNIQESSQSDNLTYYFHQPFDTIYALLRAYPHLSAAQQTNVKVYLKNFYAKYPLYQYNSTGWSGVPRETYIQNPDTPLPSSSPQTYSYMFKIYGYGYLWRFNPQSIYAAWLYAKTFKDDSDFQNDPNVDPQYLLQQFESKSIMMEDFANIDSGVMDDPYLMREEPYVTNAFIAGYMGWKHLAEMAGDTTKANQLQIRMDRLLTLRRDNYSKDTPWTISYVNGNQGMMYHRNLNLSRNFLYMVPEFADYLESNNKGQVIDTVNEFNTIAPYWYISRFNGSYGESVSEPLHDYHALFQAKALILKEPFEELVQYIDVPAFEKGDMYYIDNLVSLLEAPTTGITVSPTPNGSGSPTPTSTPSTPGDTDGDTDVDIFDYNAVITDFGKTGGQGFSAADFDTDGDVDIFDYNVVISNFGQ